MIPKPTPEDLALTASKSYAPNLDDTGDSRLLNSWIRRAVAAESALARARELHEAAEQLAAAKLEIERLKTWDAHGRLGQ